MPKSWISLALFVLKIIAAILSCVAVTLTLQMSSSAAKSYFRFIKSWPNCGVSVSLKAIWNEYTAKPTLDWIQVTWRSLSKF